MDQPKRFRLVLSMILCFLLQTQGADKYTDENRPYEFGFKIDGQQHRHESKDKDGIIMGEFGFITADDVYHVTVYATDKEGRFKILSMKNIHLKSTPASSPGLPASTASPRQGHALSLPPAQPASVQAPTALQAAPAPPSSPAQPFQSLEPPGRSCSSCSLPPTSTKAPPPAYNQANSNNNYNSPSAFGPGSSPQNQETFPTSYTGLQPNVQSRLGGSSYSPQGVQPGNPQQGPSVSQNYPQQASGVPNAGTTFGKQDGLLPQNYPSAPSYAQGPGTTGSNSGGNSPYTGSEPSGPSIPQDELSGPNDQSSREASYPHEGGRTSKQYNGPEQQFDSNGGPNNPQSPGSAPGGQRGSAKPTLVSAQMQIVDKNTDIHALRPGEKEGLPPGLTKTDMTQLLYTFNYTVGFHGHFEEGYTNGAKKGYYYVTGRNGVRTRIDYVADDTGFHPKVSQDVLDLLSDDVPKPETEKDAKFGLKGYEFKWLYYPVESKRP